VRSLGIGSGLQQWITVPRRISLLKYQDGIAKIQGSEAARLLADVKRELAAAG
jgi:hypothetical protein